MTDNETRLLALCARQLRKNQELVRQLHRAVGIIRSLRVAHEELRATYLRREQARDAETEGREVLFGAALDELGRRAGH